MAGWPSGFRAQTGYVASDVIRCLGEAAAPGWRDCGPCPDFVLNTLAFALQLRKITENLSQGSATEVLQSGWLFILTLFNTLVWTFPRSPPGTSTSTTTRKILVQKVELCGRELADNFAGNCDFHVNSGIFHMTQICDMAPTLYLPSERRRAEDFFGLKSPDGFGRVFNLRTRVLKGSTLPLDHRSRKCSLGFTEF